MGVKLNGAWFKLGTDIIIMKCTIRSLMVLIVTTDCEWKAQAGNVCVASFDWTCSGICKSSERIKEVHRRCGEGENALWNAVF